MFSSALVMMVAVVSVTVAVCEMTAMPGSIDSMPRSHSQKSLVMSSGFLKGVDSARKLHYWYIEAENSTSSAPLVIWINGGAGCSAIRNVVFDNGPFRVVMDHLVDNDYSWTAVANMLYIDVVMGVGYSHSREDHLWTTDDAILADTLGAIADFLEQNKQLSNNDVYVAGSYQAAYNVIKVSSELKGNSKVNFKGLAVGNGLYDMKLEFNSKLYYGQNRAAWDQEGAKQLAEYCCPGSEPDSCDFFKGQLSYQCFAKTSEYLKILNSMNQYDFYASCYRNNYETDCLDDFDTQNYLSDYNVKNTLKVEENPVHYSSCNRDVVDTFMYRRHDLVKDLNELKKEYKILMYAGDKSVHGNHRQNDAMFDSLDFASNISERVKWVYKDEDSCYQVGGFTKESGNVKLLQLRGAGSLVSRDKPVASLQMITEFLLN